MFMMENEKARLCVEVNIGPEVGSQVLTLRQFTFPLQIKIYLEVAY